MKRAKGLDPQRSPDCLTPFETGLQFCWTLAEELQDHLDSSELGDGQFPFRQVEPPLLTRFESGKVWCPNPCSEVGPELEFLRAVKKHKEHTLSHLKATSRGP